MKSRMWERLKSKCRLLLLMPVLLCFLCFGTTAQASSASISIDSKSVKYYTGEMIYVVITVKSNVPIKSFQGTFSYDNSVLRYMTGGSIASGNDNEFYISDTERDTAAKTLKYSIKFYARKAAGTTVALKKPYIVYGEDGTEMSVSFNSLNMLIEQDGEADSAKPTASAKPKETPKASSSPAPTKSPKPTKTPKPSKKPKDKSGDNKKPIAASPTPKTDAEGKAQGGDKISASRSGDNVTLYCGAKYVVEELPDGVEIPEGFGVTQVEMDGELVTAYALESDTEHSYFLIYCRRQKKGEEAAFYLYDKEEKEFMLYEKVQSWYRGIGEKAVVGERRSAAAQDDETLRYIIAVLVVFCILMLLAVISVFLHFKGNSGEEWQEFENKL